MDSAETEISRISTKRAEAYLPDERQVHTVIYRDKKYQHAHCEDSLDKTCRAAPKLNNVWTSSNTSTHNVECTKVSKQMSMLWSNT